MREEDGRPDVLDAPGAGGLVVRGGALRIAGFASGILLGLAGVVVLTRHLGAVDYGRYQAVTALVAIVASLSDAGLATLAVRDHAQLDGTRRERLLEAVLGLRLLLAAAAVVVAAGVAAALGYGGPMVAGAALAALAGLPNALAQTASVPLQSALRIGTVTALDLGRQAVTTALIVGLVVAGAGLVALLAVPAAAALALAVVTVLVAGGLPRPVVRCREAPRLLRTGAAVGFATAAGVLYLYASMLVCKLVAGPAEAGYYSVSFRVVVIVAAVPALLGTSAFPLLARAAVGAPERFARVATGLVEGLVLLGGAAMVGTVLGAPAIIAVVGGDAYEPSIAPLRIQGVALGLTFAIAALGFTLLARHAQRTLLVCNLVGFAASATVVAVAAGAYGERGAAAGAAIGEAILCVAYVAAVLRVVRLRPRRVPRIAVALAGALAIGAAAPVPAVPAVAIGLLVYAGLALAVDAVSPELRTTLHPTMSRG